MESTYQLLAYQHSKELLQYMLIIFIATCTCFRTPFVHTPGFFLKSDPVSIEQCYCHYITIYKIHVGSEHIFTGLYHNKSSIQIHDKVLFPEDLRSI